MCDFPRQSSAPASADATEANAAPVPAVSVIVPVYKAEAYIRRCLDSLAAQTQTDFEVLLVDDGSPDGSGAICDEYAARDPRFRAFHKANGGVASARQYGLDRARGEYVIHADPDDWVESEMLETLYRKAQTENADMVLCDYYRNEGGRQTYVVQRPSALDHATVLREMFQQLRGSCCNKLVKRACYNAYGVAFPYGVSMGEDLLVNVALLLHPLRVAYVPRAFYHYEQDGNANSLTQNRAASFLGHSDRFLPRLDALLSGTPFARLYLVNLYRDAYLVLYMDLLTPDEFAQRYARLAELPPYDWESRAASLALRHYWVALGLVRARMIAGRLLHALRHLTSKKR